MCIFGRGFSKEDLVDSNLEKLCKLTLEQRNKFLIEEFEHLMSEIICPDEYIKDVSVIECGEIMLSRKLSTEEKRNVFF